VGSSQRDAAGKGRGRSQDTGGVEVAEDGHDPKTGERPQAG